MLLPSAEGEGCSNDVLECGVGVSWAWAALLLFVVVETTNTTTLVGMYGS